MSRPRKPPKTASKSTEPPKPSTPQTPIARLLAGVDGFNAWRTSHLDAPVDLTAADLRGADLRGAFLVGARMNHCQLDDATLEGATLSGATLDGASLRRADLRGACLGPPELIDAKLSLSALGKALVTGASLRGASLEAARFNDAQMRECDLTDANLTDCDLRGANLKNARVGQKAPKAPPSTDEEDFDALWARLAAEPLAVRDGILLFGLMVHLTGDQNEESGGTLSSIVELLGFTQDDINRLVPDAPILLESQTITPPSSHWARRVVLMVMCGLAGTNDPVQSLQLQALGHFGEQLGFSDRAMARIFSEELGLDLHPNR